MRSHPKVFSTSYQSGQSLIETVMAIFILTTGLMSGLTLAIFSFGSSLQITDRISATSLAREGLESVRRMRDTNWRQDTLVDCGGGQFCYPNWLSAGYDIRGSSLGGGRTYRILFDPTASGNKWTPIVSSPADDYRLYAQSDGSFSHIPSASPTIFFRKLNIFYEQEAPPYSATSPLVLVQSTVWWWGRGCPQVLYFTGPADTSCYITAEEYLTNWRNY